jgi:CelD/BcsL family acetyltransferase involved in cellulose biosynthesis
VTRATSPGPPNSSDERPGSLQHEPLLELDAAREEWNELAEQAGNIFSTWEWNSIWWRHFGSGRTPLVTAYRSTTGRLVALLPLYLWSERPFRIVRFVGHHVADQLGPICLPNDRIPVSDAVTAALSRYEADIFLGENLSIDEGWRSRLNAKILTRDASPALYFDGGWEEFLASRSSNLREQIRARERRLARKHDLHYRQTASQDELQKDLDTLFALHKLRWGGRPTRFAKYGAFHREFAACALNHGWLRLWFLEIDGRPRAAWYGFRFADSTSFYQGGRDPAWDKNSVGFVLLMHSIREALEDGIAEYRFLRGGEGYKYRFANLDRAVETVGLARGATPRAVLATARVARKSRMLKNFLSPRDQGR